MLPRLAGALAPCVLTAVLAGQDPAPPRPTDRFEAPAGCQVGLFAESPHLFNPTALDVDHRGRVWVTEAVNYRKWRGGNQGRKHPQGDRVVILTDTDGDGVCDTSKVFVQEAELVAPLGICVVGHRVLVSCSPHAILYTDTDGDDRPDRREVFLTGFGGRDHDHGLHSFVRGPDGYLYFNTGNAGPHQVRDRAGFQIRVDRGRGLRSDDGRLWIGGLVMRVRPDGTGLRILAHNFRNPYEVAPDAFGNLFQSDNDDDGNRGCRTGFVMEGGNYGYYSADGRRSWRADRRPGQTTFTAHWHQDDPGVLPAGSANGAGGPTGVAVYEGPDLPGCPAGTVLNCDAGAGVVYAHLPRARGAGFELTRTVFLQVKAGTGGSRARWFRPSDVVVAPDGALLVADWFDPGVGGHAAGDRAAYGRILRIQGPGPAVPPPDLSSPTGLVAALGNPAVHVRGLAAERLRAAGAAGQAAVQARWRSAAAARDRARALWWLAGSTARDQALAEGLRDPDADLRVTAIRATRQQLPAAAAWAAVRGLARDPSPAVRREVLLAMPAVPFEQATEALVAIAAALDPADRFLVEALGTAVHGREAPAYALLLARLGDQPLKWSDRFAAIAWRLHPPAAVPAHLARALAPTLALAPRTRAIDAIAFVDDQAAGRAMQRLATTGPADTRPLAGFWLRSKATAGWRSFGIDAAVADRPDARLLWSSGLLRRGTKAFDVAVEPGRQLWLVVGDGGNGYACDWADWIEPTFVGADHRTPLTSLQWTAAKAGWGQVRIDKSAGGGILSTDGQQPLRGIGTHAPSEITYRVPAGARRLQGRVGPDFGGLRQAGGTSVEFAIYQQTAPPTDHLLTWRKALLDARRPLAERQQVAVEMARDPDGGPALIGLLAQDRLPAALRPAVAAAIFKHPNPSVRLQASRYLVIPGTEHLALPKLEEIARLTGRPAQGRAHFTRLCASCHVFGDQGKDIGPELTAIRQKYGTAALLEAILNPDAGIAFGYENYVIEKRNGEFVLGFILADGDTVVVKDQDGRRHAIASKDIKSRQRSPKSLMPATLVAGLKAGDLADLAAFLLAR